MVQKKITLSLDATLVGDMITALERWKYEALNALLNQQFSHSPERFESIRRVHNVVLKLKNL